MKQTSNYKLNLWDKTDRIVMEDFNRDNAKVDAALAAVNARADTKAEQSGLNAEAAARQSGDSAEKTAREAADTALGGRIDGLVSKAGMQPLGSQRLDADTQLFVVSLSGIDWSQWSAIHILIDPAEGSGTYSVYPNEASFYSWLASGCRGRCHAVLYPLFGLEMPFSGAAWHTKDCRLFTEDQLVFRDIRNVALMCSDSHIIKAGTTATIWGVK